METYTLQNLYTSLTLTAIYDNYNFRIHYNQLNSNKENNMKRFFAAMTIMVAFGLILASSYAQKVMKMERQRRLGTWHLIFQNV
jgi:hypothetical protein